MDTPYLEKYYSYVSYNHVFDVDAWYLKQNSYSIYNKSFLTRGALWLNWEKGFQHFLKYQLDADWSICAGNWMWVSSSAFEKLLDSSLVNCPISFGKRLDPNGEYIKRYVPELKMYPKEYMYELYICLSTDFNIFFFFYKDTNHGKLLWNYKTSVNALSASIILNR